MISLTSAGMQVSIYALGVTIGALVLTALAGRLPRKQLLVVLMVLFTAGNLLACTRCIFRDGFYHRDKINTHVLRWGKSLM